MKSTVYVAYAHNYARVVLSTGVRVNDRDWKNGELQRSDPEYRHKKEIIDSYFKDVSAVVTTLKLSGKEPTVENVKAYLNKRADDSIPRSMIGDIESYIERRKPLLAMNSLKNFNYTKNLLKDFEEFHKIKLDVESLDSEMWMQIVNYMIQVRMLKNNTISKHAAVFKTFLIDIYPDENFSHIKYKYIQPTIITLRET
ncbi:MAG TPA: phage integrase SAM-like domain-containing protein, partial [Bacteroidales bacterium]|nr:phage integrase SAM-like domain-containing protein [Bacteroidales bacterium]